MPIKVDPNIKRAEKPVTFYAYTQGDSGLRLATRTSVVLYAERIKDTRTGLMTFDHMTQRKAKFQKGIYQTDIIEDIAFLRSYNKETPNAKIVITETAPQDQNVKIVTKEVTKEKVVIPLIAAKAMDATTLITLMKEKFQYNANGESVADLIKEGTDQGFFVE